MWWRPSFFPPPNSLGFRKSDSLAQLQASGRQIARFGPTAYPSLSGQDGRWGDGGVGHGWVVRQQQNPRVSVRTTKRCSVLYCGQTLYAVMAKIGNSIISDVIKQHVYFSSPMKTPHLSLHTWHSQNVRLFFWMEHRKAYFCKVKKKKL